MKTAKPSQHRNHCGRKHLKKNVTFKGKENTLEKKPLDLKPF